MNERERIEEMAAAGTITREEADRLLAVLDDLDGVETAMGEVDATARVVDPESPSAETPEPAPDVIASGPPAAEGLERSVRQVVQGARERARHGLERELRELGRAGGRGRLDPEGVRWLRIEMLAGDVDVHVDAEASAVRATVDGEREIELEDTEQGLRLRQFPRGADGSFLDRLLGGLRRGDTEVVLPPGWGIELAMKAGDVSLQGVAWLRGHLVAGDVDADALEGIDLTMNAGDVDVALHPTVGEHRIALSAGDVEVRLRQGSSVRVEGAVSIGDATVSAPLTSQRRGMGERFEGTVGDGAAELELRLSTGDVTVRVEEADHG